MVWAADAKAARSILMLVKRLGQLRINALIFCFPITFAGIKVSFALGVRVREINAVLINLLKTFLTVATGTRLHVTRAYANLGLLQIQGATLDWQLVTFILGAASTSAALDLLISKTVTTFKTNDNLFILLHNFSRYNYFFKWLQIL